MKKHIYPILLLLICLILSFYFAEDQSETTVEVSAESLWYSFKYDSDMAESTYENKQVIVTGEIAEPPAMFMQQLCILLENGEDSIPDGIFCMFPADYDAHSYNVGDTISVDGKCNLAIQIAGDNSNPFIFIEDACMHETNIN